MNALKSNSNGIQYFRETSLEEILSDKVDKDTKVWEKLFWEKNLTQKEEIELTDHSTTSVEKVMIQSYCE